MLKVLVAYNVGQILEVGGGGGGGVGGRFGSVCKWE